MDKHTFPTWAPAPVITEWEEKTKESERWSEKYPLLEPDTNDSDLLYRLLTYPDMKQVWEKLPKYKIKPDLFSSMVLLSIMYIDHKPYNLTPKEYQKWIEDVKNTALKLRELIKLTDYDTIFQERYHVKRQKHMLTSIMKHTSKIFHPDTDIEEHKKTSPDYKSWPNFLPSLLSDALLEISNLASDDNIGLLGTKTEKSIKLEKPNHPNAQRSYFIKKLTQLLKKQTGKPLREIVTITTATTFDNPSLTERQIIRTAP